MTIRSISAAPAWGGVLAAGALWGVGAVAAQWLIGRGLSPQALALMRFVLGLPLLWWLHARHAGRGRWASLGWRERALVAGTGAATAVAVTCWFAGIAVLGAGLPTLISICGAPVVVALVSVMRGYERLSGRLLAALVLALGGVGLMVLPSGAAPSAGGPDAARYAAGIAWSAASAAAQALVVLGTARMPRSLPPVTTSAWSMAVSALCMLAVVLPGGMDWPRAGADWLGVAYTGVVTTSVAYLLFAWGARRLSPTAANVGIMVEPLVALLLGAALLGEAVTARQSAGAVLLIGAVALLGTRR